MKIAFINNYSMDKAFSAWKAGAYPGHHLWGTTSFHNYGIETLYLQHEKYKLLNKIGKIIKINYLDQQLRMLAVLKNVDLIYAPCGDQNTRLLIILKILRLIKVPIVILVHQPLFSRNKNRSLIEKYLYKYLYSKYDKIIFLSKKLKDEFLNALDLHDEGDKYPEIDWGADINFYESTVMLRSDKKGRTPVIISAGNTGRDFNILIEAAKRLPYDVRIYCTSFSKPNCSEKHHNVLVDSLTFRYDFHSPKKLLAEYQKADLIAIPLNNHQTGLQGYTSLLDAMAMGIPVIMTNNPYININVQKEKIGLLVEPGDKDGWIYGIQRLIENKRQLKIMGARTRMLCKNNYNIEIFSKAVAMQIVSAVERSQ
jgi:glycosyltransferase involved in cell wall biosynthesis